MKKVRQNDCLNCGKEVSRKPKIYCDNKCQQEYQYKHYIDRWKLGLESGVSGEYGTSKQIRRYLFEKYDSKCCKCGWNKGHPLDGKIPLEIDHKDGNFRNNDENNIELICPNCHSLTPTYKARNKNGRKARAKYS